MITRGLGTIWLFILRGMGRSWIVRTIQLITSFSVYRQLQVIMVKILSLKDILSRNYKMSGTTISAMSITSQLSTDYEITCKTATNLNITPRFKGG